ncbi:G-patch domain and KOW motifs-containing protein-like [Patiria miniata]|uniref:G-patch domain-containing protein n=1 Tax=Patiria miniata TaxID=46514 RepID=A0A914ADQ0_PATMI|nr:G-patch domain and KOW motifs-containing protein-like [Patiria miniata]
MLKTKMAEQEELETGKISFGFTKKKKSNLLETNVREQSTLGGKGAETDFVHALEGKEVKSIKPKEKEKPLVIPLIKHNVYGSHGNRQPNKEKVKGPADVLKTSTNSLEDDAVKEIIKDAAQYNEEWEGRGNEDLNLTIPILMQNRVPEGTETDDKLDVSIRPDAASSADYNQVPIEQFGMAMLRGMGWNEQEGIGAKMKKVVKPIEAVLRPKGQGLGADRRPGDMLDKKRLRKLKPGDKKIEEEVQGFAKGVGVLVRSGAHKNLYGKIEGVDEDNARLVIKLALSGQAVTLGQYNVKIVDKEEYKRFSKDLSRFSKGQEEQSEEAKCISHTDYGNSDQLNSEEKEDPIKHRTSNGDSNSEHHRESRRNEKDRERRKHGHQRQDERSSKNHQEKYRDRQQCSDREERQMDSDKKRRKIQDKYDSDSGSYNTPSANAQSREQSYWLRPDLRVRFIDRQYKKGRYYNSKVCIVDVIAQGICTCRTEDGRILEDIDQSMLETLIPRGDMACVMIVAGELCGQLGSVVMRDKSKANADVQLLRDRDQIKRLDYDDICEYAGNIHDEEDY